MQLIHHPRSGLRQTEAPLIDDTSHIVHSLAGAWTSIGPRNKITESSIGDYTYTMEEVTINYSEIGKYGSIASHVCINPVQHPMDRVTQHHMTYRRIDYGLAEKDDEAFFDWRRTNRVTIGHDVWIGHGAIIMKNVTVGTGAVIASGAVVTKDVAPYTVVAGVPARPVKTRFSQEIFDGLLQTAWWDWPRELLMERYPEFQDVERFIARYASPAHTPSIGASD